MKNKIALLYTYLLKIKMFISTYVKKIKYRRNRWMYLINMVKNLLMFFFKNNIEYFRQIEFEKIIKKIL